MPAVALFVPCYASILRPGDAAHAERVLRALGDEVTLVSGPCCGQPAFNSGYRVEARQAGRAMLRELRHHATVVVPSGSCTAMVRHYLPTLFEGRASVGAAAITTRFAEFGEYVALHPGLAALELRLDGVVAYHDSCHARRELGLTGTATGLLGRVEGLEVRRLAHEEECCGFGGTFSAKQPETAAAMAAAKVIEIEATGARVVTSCDLSCLANIEASARGRDLALEGWSLAELLARALPA